MTIHEKYGLKTDVKSIRERMESTDFYTEFSCAQTSFHGFPDCTVPNDIEVAVWKNTLKLSLDLRSADFALLCELAEIGERTLEISKHTFDPNIKRAIHGNKIITEVQGGK